MAKYEVRVILERPGRDDIIIRNFSVDIPAKEFEGFRDRDVFVYARTRKVLEVGDYA